MKTIINEFKEDRENYVKSIEQIGEAIGEVVFIMRHWKSKYRPDFLLILECLDEYRDTIQHLAELNMENSPD